MTRAFLIDIDGTTLLGSEPLPGALDFVGELRARKLPFCWITNNTSRSRAGWLERLAAAGFAPAECELFTAGDATITALRAEQGSTPARVFLVGTRALRADFEAAGIDLVEEAPDVLVLGYDTELA